MSNKYKILVIEDEANIRSFMRTILETNGYQALEVDACIQGKTMFFSHLPDVVILDLGLPDMDGLEFIKDVRQSSAVPIIILSARTQESDKITALDLGANDYVTKPFKSGELLARIRVALRSLRATEAGNPPDRKFSLGEMEIDYDKRVVLIAGHEVKLTQTEYNILLLLSENAGKIMTYSAIIDAVWGCSDHGSIKKLQVNMANIRKKLGWKPGENRYLINELGVGYRMREENEI